MPVMLARTSLRVALLAATGQSTPKKAEFLRVLALVGWRCKTTRRAAQCAEELAGAGGAGAGWADQTADSLAAAAGRTA